MGYYYTDRPPEKDRWWKKYIPRWLKQFLAETEEVLLVTRVTFSIILPVLGVFLAFMLFFFGGFILLSICTSG